MTPRSTSARQRDRGRPERAAPGHRSCWSWPRAAWPRRTCRTAPAFAQTVRGVTGPDGVGCQAGGQQPAVRRDGGARAGPAAAGARSGEVLGGRTAADVAAATAEQAAELDRPRRGRARRLGGRRGQRRRSPTSSSAGWSRWLAGGDAAAHRRHVVDGDRRGGARPGSASTDAVLEARAGAAAGAPAASTGSSRTCCRPDVAGPVAGPRRLLRRPGLPGPGAGPRSRVHRATPTLLEAAEPHAPRGSATLQGAARPVVVALRRPRRLRGRGLPRLQRAPARDGADGAARPRRGRRRRPHAREIAPGCDWLDTHPEVVEELVSERCGLVWRKVGRREPPQGRSRASAPSTTSVRPGLARARPRPAASRRPWSTTSAGPTSSAGCSTPGCPPARSRRLATGSVRMS